MSTLAIWLFVAVVVLLIAAVVTVVLSARTTWRKGKTLVREIDGLSQDLERTVGSHQQRHEPERSEPDERATRMTG